MKKHEIWIGKLATLVNYKCRFNDGMIVTVERILPNGEIEVKDLMERLHLVKTRNLTEDAI